MLTAAEEIPRPPLLQIRLGDLKAVGGGGQGFQASHGLLLPAFGHQDAVGPVPPPAHPAPQLVQLAQTEALGIFDDDQGGVGHVHPHLHYGGGHQHLGLARGEGGHGGLLLLGPQLSVEQPHPQVGEHLVRQLGGVGLHRLQIHGRLPRLRVR